MLFRKNEQGSMVVEASLILPLFLSVLLLLITLIRISTVEIALNHGVSEATKQVAVHMYPVALGMDRLSESEVGEKVLQTVDKGKEYRDQGIETKDQLSAYSSFFPEEIGQLLQIRQDMEAGVVAEYDPILSGIFQPYVDLFIDDRMVHLERLQVTKVTLPSFGDRDAAYFGLEVRYDMPLHIPFINKQIIFKKQAYERVWIGDAKSTAPEARTPSSEDDEVDSDKAVEDDDKDYKEEDQDNQDEDKQEEEQEHKLVIDSISDPMQRGASQSKRGSIVIIGAPNTSVKIEIYYVSKFEKKLDCKRLNSEGWLKCEVEIGGNSKEGTYEAVVKVNGQEARAKFEVLSQPNMVKYKDGRYSGAKK